MTKYKYEKVELKNIIKDCLSIADICRKLNIRPVGGNYKTLNKYIKLYKLDISHFTGQAWNVGKRFKMFCKTIPLKEILIKDSTYTSTNNLKNRLLQEGYIEYQCKECGLIEWNNKSISLHLDHINGNNMDNRIENLRLLCPNCHSQTETYCNKTKVSKKSEYRKNQYEQYKNFPVVNDTNREEIKEKKKYFCKCGKEINKYSKMCIECHHKKLRRVERPEKEQLKNEVKEYGFAATGRKYNVSDNTIRKWIK